ncbi:MULTISPECIES: GntR family transcriptional regulator [unclassified Xanthobacter]|uniref:GntR family transcriptional regulator n=1 Tax=unclassified Xanthobacter TaxID=2623496 RepID=UPI001EDDC94C|nr:MULTISPECIES: GntR family transcriptional regulator [unclassified Xanthobacter]
MQDVCAHEAGSCPPNDQETRTGTPGATLADRIRKELETAISAGRIEPGSRLDEQEIADRFGVSRTPVREAFRLLAASNLVELRGRQGAMVRSIGGHTLVEMFQVMAELEGLCARLAARRITPAQIARIDAIHLRLEGLATPDEVDAFYDVNQEFHEAIYEASCNAFLAEQTRRLRNQVAAYRRRVTRMPTRIAATLKEHAAVIEAIRVHDAERAHTAMRDHVNLLGDDLLDFLAAYG